MTKQYTRSNTVAFGPAADYRDHDDEELLQALVTAGALVALADGQVDGVERDELLNFIDQQRLVPTISQHEIARAFDSRVQQIKNQHNAADIAQPLRPLIGLSLASVVIRTAERVAAADSQIHPSEVEAVEQIRLIMTTPSDRTHTVTPHASFAEIVFFIAVLGSACIGEATILAVAANELANWTATQNAEEVPSANVDNYLELFASGPGRGWYVLGKTPCDVDKGSPRGRPCEPLIDPPAQPSQNLSQKPR
jgi:tellurite resistance protein